jgi:hypothetical protein
MFAGCRAHTPCSLCALQCLAHPSVKGLTQAKFWGLATHGECAATTSFGSRGQGDGSLLRLLVSSPFMDQAHQAFLAQLQTNTVAACVEFHPRPYANRPTILPGDPGELFTRWLGCTVKVDETFAPPPTPRSMRATGSWFHGFGF